jgi:hypothetical protein
MWIFLKAALSSCSRKIKQYFEKEIFKPIIAVDRVIEKDLES